MDSLNDFYFYNQEIAKLLPLWTQGAGSNISCKIDNHILAIKASGFRLDQVGANSGYVHLDFLKLRTLLQNILRQDRALQEVAYSEALAATKTSVSENLRPSMEAGFHAFSTKKWVAHFHSLPSVLMAEVKQTEPQRFQDWCQRHNWQSWFHFIPLSKPGWELSVFFQDNPSPVNIIVNHGVILQSDDLSLLATWDKMEDQFLSDFNFTYLSDIKKCLKSNSTKSDNSLLITQMKTAFNILKGPVKFYFPDMAIYFSKLEPYLKSTGDGEFELLPTASEDLKEIWMATQILYHSMPSLTEIPEKMTAEITQLPTEKLRQKFLK